VATIASPQRQIRAAFSQNTITVYQAYSHEIATPSLLAGRLVPPFSRERMTWIKPSFLWMMYRSGWATKPGQESVLAIEMSRSGFEWALAHSALSRFDPAVHASPESWKASQRQPVRIQWDPERDLYLQPAFQRSIQVGLGSEAVHRYVDEWTIGIKDVTVLAHSIRDRVAAGDIVAAHDLLPVERPYPLSAPLADRIGPTD